MINLQAKPTALFLAPESPYPAIGGGALRSASLLTYLAERYQVDVILFHEPGKPDPVASFPPGLVRAIHVVELPRHSKGAGARAARNMRRAVLGIAPLSDRFGGFGPQIAGLLDGRRYKLAVVEHFWCAPYLHQLKPHSDRIVLNLHNIESILHERCAQAEKGPVAWLHRRFQAVSRKMERNLLPLFSALLAASEDDAARIREISRNCRVHVYPNAIPWEDQPSVPEEDVIIFSGNLEYHPNIQAVRYFRDQIWPRLRDRRPTLVWRLAGRNPEAVRSLVAGDARIDLRGPFPHAAQALASAKVAIVPLLAGSGTRFKILEAWAAGRAVVSTTLGAEGLGALDGEHLLIADTPQKFAESVLALLDSPALRQALGKAGRAAFESRFTWQAAWDKLETAGF